MNELKIKSFGPIEEANIKFGDLTLLVGPQASGKSIFIQLLKLLTDKNHIRRILEQYGYTWGKEPEKILEFYFGEGMSKIWKKNSYVNYDGKSYLKNSLISKSGRYWNVSNAEEELFYIPAQRILCVADGRPKTFMEFDNSTPYVLKQYSETLRRLLQNKMGKFDSIFPVDNRLKLPLRNSFNQSIFHNGKVVFDEKSGQKKLRMQVEGMSVPFMTWSAGQKEFMPLLLGFYWLCPPSRAAKKDNITTVVIEEPEMGLHPQAIKSVILQTIDLLSRNYKVVISTHSPVFLEFAWAFNLLKQSKSKDDTLFKLFDIKKTAATSRLFKGILSKKKIKTFYFDRVNDRVKTMDISMLDAGSEDEAIANWGGLTDFATRAGEIVSNIVTDEE